MVPTALLEGCWSGFITSTLKIIAFAIFFSTANTALIENREYVDVTPPGNFSFATITVKFGGVAGFTRITGDLSIESSEFRVKYGGQLFVNHVQIYSTYAWVESQGIFHLDGTGFKAEGGPGAGFTIDGVGYGAAHGGQGGGHDTLLVREPYGSIFDALTLGSGGGNGGGTGGSGGGQLHWLVSHSLEMNGLLSLKGQAGVGGNAGGGSGGSVLIETTNMTGHGEINVVGGDATGAGCGGSGGRIAIHCRWRYTYGGLFVDHGGIGSGQNIESYGAAAGSAYVEENLRPLPYRKVKYLKGTNTTLLEVDHKYVHIDNEGIYVPVATVFMHNDAIAYEIDELELTGASRLIIYHPNVSLVNLTVHTFIGDKTGQLHLRSNQKVYAEVVESETNRTEAPCSFLVDYESEIFFPSEVHLHGTRTEMHGRVTGVHKMFIEDKADVIWTSTAQTAIIEKREYVHLSEEGNFSVPELTIKKGGKLSFLKISGEIIVDVADFEVKYQGLVLMNHGMIDSGHADLESEGVITLDGKGFSSGTGPGRGISVSGSGTGGSYGGQGGAFSSSNTGSPYGSVYTPAGWGSGGGSSTNGEGGSGGGFLHWKIGKLIHLNGVLSANGEAASSTNAGGGSGGSILLEATNFTGHGDIQVNGGEGSAGGSGGSGGRMGIHIDHKNDFGGRYSSVWWSGRVFSF
ncbi:Tenascin-X [Apostichopus japonicus]|uniref:Tenascin-X n=1 Tax=Stichopus japonicus TaxID=307972 RepID=A0A2G8LLG5_STIJA|nr:Tenascin-X [Apostichopus japonicus]